MIADGIDVVNLSQGEPDFNTPDNIGRAARIAIKDHLTDSYTATNGLVELKNAVVAAAKCSYVNNSECFLSRAELIRQLLFFDWQD